MAEASPSTSMSPAGLEVVVPSLTTLGGRGWWRTPASWTPRRWLVAVVAAVGTVVAIALPTAMIPNPVFGRAIPTTWWAWPVLAVTAGLGGLLAATYVRDGREVERAPRAGMVGGLLAYFAVGCPVCNKIALLALGYTGALQWFAPAQPVLAAAGIVLLAFALRQRLRGEVACPVPAGRG